MKNHYLRIKENVTEIALKCGRSPDDILLIAVSKGHSSKDIAGVYELGCRNFGENRIQEALSKIDLAPSDIHWHMIGNLQFNKVRKAIGPFELIHSVDSPKLAQVISQINMEQGVQTRVLLEVNTSGEASKHGLSVDAWRDIFSSLLRLQGIRIEGLMTMAPFVNDEKLIRSCFAKLRDFRDELGLKHLSMGMSHDYPWAILEGATLLRIGSAIFNGK